MTEIPEGIKEIFNRHNLLKKFNQQKPLMIWDRIAGNMSNFTRPLLVKEGKLVVEVSSSSVKQELSYLEDKYMEKINERLDENRIEEIEFTVTSLPGEKKEGRIEKKLKKVQLENGERQKVDELLSVLSLEGELEESIEDLIVSKLKADKIRLRNGWIKCENCGRVHRGGKCPRCRS